MNKENHKQGKALIQQQPNTWKRVLFYSFNCKLYYFRAYIKIGSALRNDSLLPCPHASVPVITVPLSGRPACA